MWKDVQSLSCREACAACSRYFVDNTTDILFERWFYCENLGTQLVPIIKEYDNLSFIPHSNFSMQSPERVFCSALQIYGIKAVQNGKTWSKWVLMLVRACWGSWCFNCWTTVFVWLDEVFREPPFQLSTMNVMTPFSFKDWLERQRPSLCNGHPIDMFGAQFETEVQKNKRKSSVYAC